jgi:hypothetical protein
VLAAVAVIGTAWLAVHRPPATLARVQPPVPDEAEARAVACLAREVPLWYAANQCFSCHNNGDAARALLVAASRGHRVGAALDDTLDWLRQPDRWPHNKTEGGIDDKPLARIQFAGALALAVRHGQASRDALARAASQLAADQQADGSWRLDTSQSLGSPTTYGTALATAAARRTLVTSERADLAPAVARADAWLRTAPADTVIDAAAILLGLEQAADQRAVDQRNRALGTIWRGEAPSGGWGPYVTVAPDVFDTALVLLALDEVARLREATASAAPARRRAAVRRGRSFLLARQQPDGSWPETTRPANQESYAQRISTTAWALLALIATAPESGAE